MNNNWLDAESRTFLRKYLNNIAPTGHEISGQRIWLDYVLNNGKVYDIVDEPYGSVAAVIKGSSSDFKFVIDAHADEISWRILHIEDSGQIGVMRNGGSDARVAPGTAVKIQAEKKNIDAVFGSPAIHVRHGILDKEEPKDEDLRVDVGAASKQEVLDMGIDVGMTITYASGFSELENGKFVSGRALDDRMCGFINAQIIRQLKEQNITLPYDLYVVNSTQEETGLRGATIMANKIKPNAAIILDVGHDTTTQGYNKCKQGDHACSKGPIISYGAPLHTKVIDLIMKTAKGNSIAIQKTSEGYSSGTNADAYAYSGEGCPSALISLPLRYMHTAVEMVSTDDVLTTQKLLFETLKAIKGEDAQFDYYANDRKFWQKKLGKYQS